jgi:hypothetical protein
VEKYDYAANKWTLLEARLTVDRCESAAACVNGCVFIVGGEGANGYLSSVECFDPVKQRFSSVTSLLQPLSRSAVVSVCVSGSVLTQLFKSG